jgi:beta-lactamase regulating signal transducer with metallopeptidase domain
MNALEHFAQKWLAWITAASWQLALLVCIVAAAAAVARLASPRLRHALWLVVLIKVFLPVGLTTPWSIGHWAVGPLLDALGASQATAQKDWLGSLPGEDNTVSQGIRQVALADQLTARTTAGRGMTLSALLLIIWAGGCLAFLGAIVWRYVKLVRAIRRVPAIDEGPVRIALEQIALDLDLRRIPELHSTEHATSPFLFGVVRPRIVLPDKLFDQLGDVELRSVLTHELVHWQRHDTWIGWFQVVGQSLYWFHPFVWWANSQLRHERECACDEAVLRLGRIDARDYGESIVRVLTVARGRTVVRGSLVGVFERGAKLQNRLEDIMSFEQFRRRFGWPSWAAVVAFAVLVLPMAPGVANTGLADANKDAGEAKPAAPKASHPQIVETNPKVGAIDVDPALQEISVTFDREMRGGMSWTGGPPLMPEIDKSRKPEWRNGRTCAIPVKLEAGSYYRVGINSESYQNFRSKDDVAAPPSAIYFATKGAAEDVKARVRAPEISSMTPANGATDMDASLGFLTVVFNTPMDGGFSWTGSGPDYPKSPAGKKPSWSADGLTCKLPVALEAEHDYRLGLNSLSHINFQSKWGVPLAPVEYKFRTRGK